MTPSWYDVLDVDPSADATAVRAAWRDSIAGLDPTDRRFRLLNQAAEVLLDPARRQAHDDQLAAESAESAEAVGVVEPAEPDEPTSPRRVASEPAPMPVAAGRASVATKTRPVPSAPEPAASAAERRTFDGDDGGLRVRVPTWLIGVVGVLTVVAVVLAAIAFSRPNPASVESDALTAEAAAEQAAGPILSYDLASIGDSQRTAHEYMTSTYATKDYDPLIADVVQAGAGTGVVITAQVIGSAIVRADDGVVDVLVFLDRSTTNRIDKTPNVSHDQVTLTMQKQDDGSWLVSNLATNQIPK